MKVDPPDPWFLLSPRRRANFHKNARSKNQPKMTPIGLENEVRLAPKILPKTLPTIIKKNHWLFDRFWGAFWINFRCQNAFKIVSKNSLILASILERFWLRKWSQNGPYKSAKLFRGLLREPFRNALKIKPRFFGVLGCLWGPFGIPQVSFSIDFRCLLVHLGASLAILGPLWLSLAENESRTSRESAENQ